MCDIHALTHAQRERGADLMPYLLLLVVVLVLTLVHDDVAMICDRVTSRA